MMTPLPARRLRAITPGTIAMVVVLGLTAIVSLGLINSTEGTSASVTLLLLGAGVYVIALLTVKREERLTLSFIFGAALALRALAAIFIYSWDPLFFSLDQKGYFLRGVAIALQWRADGSPSMEWLIPAPISILAETNHFAEMWALLSYWVGESELAMRLAMVVVGAYTAARVYVLARELFGERAGLWAGWMAACWPSLIIWSAQGLRDPLLVWLWCEVGIGVLRVCRGHAISGILGLSLTLYGFTLLRPYAAVIAGRGAVLALLLATLRGAKSVKLLAIGGVGFALMVSGLGFFGNDFLTGANLETAVEIHQGFQGGGSSFAAGVDISSLSGVVRYLPLGLAYSWLAPFPWQIGSALQMSTMLEQPIWYAVIALAILGLVAAAKKRIPTGVALMAVVLPAAAFYGLVMSNVGTAYRTRAQFTPFVFVYAAEGALAWQAKRARSRSSRRPLGTIAAPSGRNPCAVSAASYTSISTTLLIENSSSA